MEACGGGANESVCSCFEGANKKNWNTSLSTHSSHSIVLCIQLYCNTAITSIAFECFIHIYQTFRSRWKTFKKKKKKTPIKVVFSFFSERTRSESDSIHRLQRLYMKHARTHTHIYLLAGELVLRRTKPETKTKTDEMTCTILLLCFGNAHFQ